MKTESGRVNPTREGNEMPQENSGRKVKSHQQMIQALELRAAGASFRQIGEALSVSKPRAFRIVRKALDELVLHCSETAGRVRVLELHRLDRYRLSLDARRGDPRTVDTLIRISERVAKLHGLDAPQRIEASGPNGGPIETQEQQLDFEKLSFDELLIFQALQLKAAGDPNWNEGIRHYGSPEYERMWPGKPPSLVTAFVKALPFAERRTLTQGATAPLGS
jgi:hypothetical protein